MIRAAGKADVAHIKELCNTAHPLLGGQMLALLALRGQPDGLYCADDTGVLAVQGQAALLCGAACPEELAAFFALQKVRQLETETVLPTGFGWQQRRVLRRAAGGCASAPLEATSPEADSLKTTCLLPGTRLEPQPDLWRLAHAGLWPGYPPDDIYGDLRRRANRGLADIYALAAAGQYLAAAVLHHWPRAGQVLGGVATLPAAQGRGYASAVVQALCNAHPAQPVQLVCAPTLLPFYTRVGFTPVGVLPLAAAPDVPGLEQKH